MPSSAGIVLSGLVCLALVVPTVPAAAQTPVPGQVLLRVQTPSYELDAQGVFVSGYGRNDAPGAPVLPVWSTVLELPATGVPEISYQSPGAQLLTQTVDIQSVPVPVLALPGVNGWSDPNVPDSVPLVDRPDPAIYDMDTFYPASPVVVGASQWQGGRRLVSLRVFPFQYNPVTRVLRYHPDLHITVQTTQGQGVGTPVDGRPINTDRDSGTSAIGVMAANPAAATPGALRIRTGAAWPLSPDL